ncbi:MAG: metallophosphoesterase family protein [Candidatus Omnitrophica bacterium]|nr:metallophosphoesterase family protein [Candidatus Omnitrophota bacterium]
MRYAIFADIHSNLEAFDAVIQALNQESIDKYLCLGDVVGYAANPKECIQKVRDLAMITVAGNHDWASVGLFSLDYFNPVAAQALLWTKRNLDEQDRYFLESLKLIYKNEDLTLVHATLNNPQDFNYMDNTYIAAETLGLLENNICFIGHTHRPGIFIKDKEDSVQYKEVDKIDIKEGSKYIINVGSVGQPRDGNPDAAYAIYDTKKKQVEIQRISYDWETTRKKIHATSLPKFLGDRLLVGR